MAFKNKKNGKTISTDMRDQMTSFKNLAENKLPEKVEDALQDIIDDSFDNEKYEGKTGTSKWKARKNDKDGEKPRDQRMGLLIKSGGMRAETKVSRRGGTIRVKSTKNVGDGKWNVAEIHNEGLKPVPERQFMPKPGEKVDKLDKIIDDFLDEQMDKIFK